MQEVCARLLLKSVQGSRRTNTRKNEPDRAQLYKSLNGNIVALLCAQRNSHAALTPRTGGDDSAMLMSCISENLAEITHDYLWLARCCNNATEIADTFNGMHLAGILVCKSFSIVCHEPGATGKTISAFFPAYSAIHVCAASIRDMTYSELVFVLTSLQQKWDVLLTTDLAASANLLVCCMARFGHMAAMQWSSKILDDSQERENVNQQGAGSSGNPAEDSSNITGSNMWVLSKRAIRHFVTTFMCMAREMAILHASTCISINTMSYLEYSKYTTDEVMAYGFKLAPDISDEIRACFAKIKRIREAGHGSDQSADKEEAVPAAQNTAMPTADKNWDFLLKKLGPHKLGPRPRKMNAEFTTLLSDVIVSLSDHYNHPDNTIVTRSCLNIIQTALKFYYVVPSAERYREIVLMQNMCPGQRLNYAFDYMHFDTGERWMIMFVIWQSYPCLQLE